MVVRFIHLLFPAEGVFPAGDGTGATYAPVPKVTLMVIPVEAEANSIKQKRRAKKEAGGVFPQCQRQYRNGRQCCLHVIVV